MSLTFPLDRTTFFGILPISEISLDIPATLELSQSAGGDLFVANLGARLWRGTVTLGRLTYAEAAGVEGLIDVLGEAGNTFLAYDVRRPYPAAMGVSAGGAVTIRTLNGDNRGLSLQGLAAGYVLTRGDYLEFDYGSNPKRKALHRILEGTTANGAGNTVAFEVTPNIRPGAAVGASINLTRAACKAVILPGTVAKGTSRRGITEGISFSFQQTLRG